MRAEAALALLIYSGPHVREAYNLQLRDLCLPSLTISVRHGKAGSARRVSICRMQRPM